MSKPCGCKVAGQFQRTSHPFERLTLHGIIMYYIPIHLSFIMNIYFFKVILSNFYFLIGKCRF